MPKSKEVQILMKSGLTCLLKLPGKEVLQKACLNRTNSAQIHSELSFCTREQ